MRNARGFDGLGRVGGLGRKTRRLVAQRVWTRRRRLGRAGACGNATGRLNRHCQCEFEPATHPAQRPLLPGPPRSPLPAPRSSLLAPRASLLAPRLGRVGRCGRRAARVNWRLQCKSESITRRVQRPAPPRPPQGRLVQDGRWSPARSLWVAGLDSESVAQSGRAKATRGSNPEVCCVHAVHKAALGPHLAPVPSAVEADSTNANASANARSPAPRSQK